MSLAYGDEEGSMPGSLPPVGKPISSWVGRRTACILRRYSAKRKDHYSMSTVGDSEASIKVIGSCISLVLHTLYSDSNWCYAKPSGKAPPGQKLFYGSTEVE